MGFCQWINLDAGLDGDCLLYTSCVFQAVLRNPLASASTLGVSQGASFGAAFAIIAVSYTHLQATMSSVVLRVSHTSSW